MHAFICTVGDMKSLSPHVRYSRIRNPGNFGMWNPESTALESGFRNPANGILNPTILIQTHIYEGGGRGGSSVGWGSGVSNSLGPRTPPPPIYVCRVRYGLPQNYFILKKCGAFIESNGCYEFFERCSRNVLWG